MSHALALIAALLLGLWLWRNALRGREIALEVCRRACRAEDVQLLDQTVALAALGLRRGSRGRLGVRRVYHFEFSSDGSNRLRGSVTLAGAEVESLYLPRPSRPGSTETALPSARDPGRRDGGAP